MRFFLACLFLLANYLPIFIGSTDQINMMDDTEKGIRMTPIVYLPMAIFILIAIVGIIVGFFSENQTPFFVLVFILVLPFLSFFFLCLLNFVDIAVTRERKYILSYFGKRLKIVKIFKVRKLPVFMRIGAQPYTVGYLVLGMEDGRKRTRFFMIRSTGFGLIKNMTEQDLLWFLLPLNRYPNIFAPLSPFWPQGKRRVKCN